MYAAFVQPRAHANVFTKHLQRNKIIFARTEGAVC